MISRQRGPRMLVAFTSAFAVVAVSMFVAAPSSAVAARSNTVASPVATAPPATYYLALGDSLADGGGAPAGQGYVDDVFAALSRRVPGSSSRTSAAAATRRPA